MEDPRPNRAELPPPERRAGSPQPGEPDFLVVGKLRRPHGVRGELILELVTDFPERLQPGMLLFVGEDHTPLALRSRRPYQRDLLVAFDGFTTPEQSGKLRNSFVFVRTADRPPLPEGEYYHHQLIGLRVVEVGGGELGVVRDILQTGANDVYVVRTLQGAEILLPAIDSVIQEIDLGAGELRVTLLPGLLPD